MDRSEVRRRVDASTNMMQMVRRRGGRGWALSAYASTQRNIDRQPRARRDDFGRAFCYFPAVPSILNVLSSTIPCHNACTMVVDMDHVIEVPVHHFGGAGETSTYY